MESVFPYIIGLGAAVMITGVKTKCGRWAVRGSEGDYWK